MNKQSQTNESKEGKDTHRNNKITGINEHYPKDASSYHREETVFITTLLISQKLKTA